MRTDKVQVEGSRVTINADSEATARAIAAAADREVIRVEGRAADKVDTFFDEVGDRLEAVINGLNRPSLGIMGWVLGVVAGVMAYMSFGRLMPVFEVLFGIVGIVMVLAMKLSIARWAKAANLNLPRVAETYKYMAFGAAALIFVVSVAYQAAVSQDVDTGSVEIHEAVDREDRAIREAEFEAEKLTRPSDTSALLVLDIERRLMQTAQNKAGEPTNFPIGQAIGAGPRDEKGLQPATFCMPNKPMQFYIDRYCPDLIDMERDLQRRIIYEAELEKIAARKLANEETRTKLPVKSSSLALVERSGGGVDGNLWGIAFVAMGMLFVEAGMAFCTYYSKRHPKGVTAALATLATPATQGGGP